ncbi:ATP-dependent Clp protease ATP-binding subunit [Candidatus Dojkabacteria bacterium]|nr:ATP-dependent Clp protease ATP-binding subunit [Candidatus Dojkabacteria bacterium]
MKSILGYHDKSKGTYSLIQEKMPLLVDERYEPFLMSTKQFFTVPIKEIQNVIKRVPIQKTIKRFKNTVATILIVPGTISAVIYCVDFITAISHSDPIPLTLPSWLTNLTFWLAVMGAMVLWHESYRTVQVKDRIKEGSNFSDHEIKTIQKGDLGLSKLKLASPLKILTKDTLDILLSVINKNEIDTLKLLKALIPEQNCKIIIEKLDIQNFADSLEKNGINQKSLPKYPMSAVRSLLIYATEEALLTDSDQIRPEHVFISLFRVFPALDLFLKKQTQNTELMRYVSKWISIKERALKFGRTFDPNVPYYRTGGIANAWIYGYTYVLSHFSKDLTQRQAKSGGHYGIGHDREVEEVLSILGKVSKNNVLLIGESGTGKTSVAKGIAERINKGTIPGNLKDMRLIQLDVNGLIAAAPQFGNVEALVQQSMDELQRAGNTILFIDEIQEIVPAKGQESQHSLAGILLPYVLESKFPIIGTITYADYKKFFYSRESLRQSFQSVEIKEVTPEAAFEILLTRLEELQQTYDLEITFPAILASIELAQRYVYDRKLPDSAVNLMESACAAMQNSGKKKLTATDIARTISTQTEIPVEEVTTDEATKLLDLEKKMKEIVIGQDEAVHQVVEALKRSRTGVRDPNKPIGTFLFLGPTGVGKTYLAKTLSKEYFGEQKEIIRVDMSELKEVSGIQRLLGSSEMSETAQSSTTLLDQVKLQPFSVILFDEIEKAHPQVLDLLLQLLDEGRLTSTSGETVNFNNTIIICTSNIGSKKLLDALEQDMAMFEEAKERVLLELRQKVRVEFLNRFDRIIVFAPHPIENLTEISELLLKELKARLLEKEITLEWDDNLPRFIAQNAQEPGLGARPLRRYIQEKIEGVVATKLLQNEIKPGDTFKVTTEMLSDTKV